MGSPTSQWTVVGHSSLEWPLLQSLADPGRDSALQDESTNWGSLPHTPGRNENLQHELFTTALEKGRLELERPLRGSQSSNFQQLPLRLVAFCFISVRILFYSYPGILPNIPQEMKETRVRNR